jgi:iron complex outermembrane recepter protein
VQATIDIVDAFACNIQICVGRQIAGLVHSELLSGRKHRANRILGEVIMKNPLKICLLSTIGFGGMAFAMPALAQDAPADVEEADSGSATIVVTARKRQENIIDVPLAVSVATQEQLQRDQINSLSDLSRIAPALEISQTSGGETNGGGRLRGLGTGVFNPSVASSVAFVVDQVPVGNLAFPQLFDLAQVEVLRGPQGTLFGQGASAGVINVSTRAPSTDALGANASVDFADKGTAGSEVGELIVNAGINIPAGDKAAFRVAAQYKKETGLQRSATTGLDNKITDYGFRAKALLMPSDTFTVNLTAEYAKEVSNGQTFFAIAVAPNSTTPFGPPGGTLGGISNGAFLSPTGCAMPVINARAEYYCENLPSFLKLSTGGVSAAIDWELSDSITLTSVSGYRERNFKQYSRDFSRITGTFAARQERTQEDSRGFSQELRLGYEGDAFDLVVGGFYSDYRYNSSPLGTGPFAFNVPADRVGFSICNAVTLACIPQAFTPGPRFVTFTKETTENHSLAGFIDATFNLSEQIELFGGLRISDYKNITKVGINTLTPNSSFETSDSDLSGRAGVSFKPNPNTNLYASFSRGYKPPAVGTNPAGTLFQLAPEKADAFELGAKFGVGRFQLAANAFYNTISNFQSQTSVFVGTALVSQPLNIPEVKSKGFELTAMGQIAPGLSINGGYQYNDIKYPSGYCGDDDVIVVATGLCSGNLGGKQFLNAPKHKLTLSGEYAAAVGGDLELFLNANFVYKTKVLLAARADPRFRYPAHEIINLGFGLRDIDGAWNASVFVRNLTKEREPTAYLASTFAGQADGGIRAWPVAGLTARVVGIRAGFNF